MAHHSSPDRARWDDGTYVDDEYNQVPRGFVDDEYNQAPRRFDEQPYDYPYGEDSATFQTSDYTSLPDVLQLLHLCANAFFPRFNTPEARAEADESWEPVREWLRTHSAAEVRVALEQRGESSMTALHFACRNRPPLDVINVFLSIAPETCQWPDSFGWLPLHYACGKM
jgi:hypothetical protein